MANFLKKLASGIGKPILALVIVFAFFIGYGLFAEKSASKKAIAMCASIVPNSDASTLRNRAIQDGAHDRMTRWFNANGYDNLFITYVGIPPFSRRICYVKASNGLVISATLSRLD